MRVFLDASVFVWAMERPESNSARVLLGALNSLFDPVVDEEVLAEVLRYFRARRGRSFAWLYTQQIRRVAQVLSLNECEPQFAALKSRLKPGDRFHLAAARASGAEILVAYDSDFAPFPEYRTPKQAAKRLGLPTSATDW